MPTRSDLLQEIRKADPRAANVPDDELAGALAQKYPQYADVLKGGGKQSTFSRIEQLRAQAPKGEVAKKAATHLRNIGVQKAGEEYESDVQKARGRFIGEMASAAPVLAATAMTGGMAAVPAIATMGAAGAIGGALREAGEGAGGEKKSLKEIAFNLGLDATFGMLLEGGGRAIGTLTKSMIPRAIMKSAVKSEAGEKTLQTAFVDTRQKLYQAVAGKHVDITGDLMATYDQLATMPRGLGKFGQRFSAPTEKAAEVMRAIEEDLQIGKGGSGVSNIQPLDALIRIRGSLNQLAWKGSGVGVEEAEVLQRLSGQLDKTIRGAVKNISPEAHALYEQANGYMTMIKQKDIATSFASRFIQSYARHAVYAGIGGYAGYRKGGYKGAIAGAAVGTGLDAAMPQLSAWVLDQVLHNKGALGLMKKAIDTASGGGRGDAMALATRAFLQAGVAPRIKEAIRHPEVIAPTQPPEQMTPPATAQR